MADDIEEMDALRLLAEEFWKSKTHDTMYHAMAEFAADAFERGRRHGLYASKRWDGHQDTPLPEQEEIDAQHPMRSKNHKRFEEAMRMVGAKHSKYGLVGLVNWLLWRIENARSTP